MQKLNSESEEYNIKNSTSFFISGLYNFITEYYFDSELMFKTEFSWFKKLVKVEKIALFFWKIMLEFK